MVPDAYRHPVVVGHPNYLGVFERECAAPLICLAGAWSALRHVPEGATTVVVDASHPLPLAKRALENVRTLAKHVRQIPGVHLALKPRSPILVLLAPRSVAGNALPETVDTLDGVYPELPGGLRVELTPDTTAIDVTRYAAILEQIIGQEV